MMTQHINEVIKWWSLILDLELEPGAWTSQATTCGHCPVASCYTGCYCWEEFVSMIFLTSFPVVTDCSCISTDPPFPWTKQAQILHPLSVGHVPLTIMVSPGGPSWVSPNSPRSSDPPRRSEPSACWPCSSQCTPVCRLPFLQLELPHLNIQPCVHWKPKVLSSISRLDFGQKLMDLIWNIKSPFKVEFYKLHVCEIMQDSNIFQ